MNSKQQEVLLITGTGFASREYTERDTPDNAKKIPGKERLKDACWNGLIREMIPEIFTENHPAEKLFLWHVREANQFFALEMSEYPSGVDKFQSIDPYRFMEVQEYN